MSDRAAILSVVYLLFCAAIGIFIPPAGFVLAGAGCAFIMHHVVNHNKKPKRRKFATKSTHNVRRASVQNPSRKRRTSVGKRSRKS